jgi:hypothetical protein
MTETELEFKATVDGLTRPAEFEKLLYERYAGAFSRSEVKHFVSRLLAFLRTDAKANEEKSKALNGFVAELVKAQCDWANKLTKM